MSLTRRSLLRAGSALAAAALWPFRRVRAEEVARGLVVHEWGVVRCSSAGHAGEGVDVASRFPPFVYSRRSDHRRFMAAYETARETPVRVEKPVVHLYGPAGLRVRFAARFAEGRPLVWWPRADWEETGLTWDVELADSPGGEIRPIEPGHWFGRLREPEAMWCRAGDQTERFLYYDGESRYRNPLAVRRAGDGWTVENGGTDPAEDLYLAAGGAFVAFRARLAPGETWTPTEPLGEEPARHLAGRLVAAGLTAAEAGAIASIWEQEFFGGRRLVLVHRLAEGVYDRLFPAEVDPRPDAFVRVGLALVGDQDPDLGSAIEALIGELAADDYEARSRAELELTRIGRPATAALARAEMESPDVHVRHRAQAIRLAIEGRAGGDVLTPDLEVLYEEWKRTGAIDPYSIPRRWRG